MEPFAGFTTANGSLATIADSREEAAAAFAAHFEQMVDSGDLDEVFEFDVVPAAELSRQDYELGYDAFQAGRLWLVAC
jgi:hypothetical protein